MRRDSCQGLTLPEVLVVVSMLSLVMLTIIMVLVQTGRIYRNTVGQSTPQVTQELALKRLKKEISQAVALNINVSSATQLQIAIPEKESDGYNQIVQGSTGKIGLQTGHLVTYFLGVKQPTPGNPTAWTAVPSDTGDTLFRVTDLAPEQANNTNADIMIEGIAGTPKITDFAGNEKTTSLFTYGPTDHAGVLVTDPNLVVITFSTPVTVNTPQGHYKQVYHASSTQIYMRNIASATS